MTITETSETNPSSPPPSSSPLPPSKVTASNSASLPYPKGAIFILIGYLLERFVYYGLFGSAVFYMQRVLHFSSSTSATLKAVIEGLIYLAPIVGAVLADTYFGKFRTVLTMCIVYTCGAFIFTLSAVKPMMAGIGATQAAGMSGMFVLGLSAGLMKAVYSSLGPDQFKVPEQRKEQERYFYAFYWMINAGAFVGVTMTAQMRANVQCFGDDCYMLPFLILCGVMILSTLIFFMGKKTYYQAPPDTTLIDSTKCVFFAVNKSIMDRKKPVDHWLNRSIEKFDSQLIEDVKRTIRVLLVFVTFPFFWALFYQTSTGMIFQAKRLDDRIGSFRIPPEVTSSVNPLLILILIPLFEFVIYPFLNRKHLLQSVTIRMTLGMGLACISFILYGIVNTSVEQNILAEQQSKLSIYNVQNCTVNVVGEWLPETITIPMGEAYKLEMIELNAAIAKHKTFFECGENTKEADIELLEEHETTVVLFPSKVLILDPSKEYLKHEDAESKVRIITDEMNASSINPYQLIYKQLVQNYLFDGEFSDFKAISPQSYDIERNNVSLGEVNIRQDGVYDVLISEGRGYLFHMTEPSTTHMGWLFPQYIFITTGEVLFSVSSMDFAYSEAPKSMKAVMQAANLFTITIGLWMFAIFNKISDATGTFDYRGSNEAFTYAFGMAVNTVIFFFVARYYDSKKQQRIEEEASSKKNEGRDAGIDNAGFKEEQM